MLYEVAISKQLQAMGKCRGAHSHAHKVADGVVFALQGESCRICNLGVLLEGDPGGMQRMRTGVQADLRTREFLISRLALLHAFRYHKALISVWGIHDMPASPSLHSRQ